MYRHVGIVLVLGVSLVWSARATMQTPPPGIQRPAGAPAAVMTGTLTAVWGDPPQGSSVESKLLFTLTDDGGTEHELIFEDGVLEAAGGLTALDRRRVTIGVRDGFAARGARLVTAVALDKTFGPIVDRPSITGAQPWITILCRFADTPSVTPNPVSYFQGLLGTAAPGMDHYWRETSYNLINLTGTGVVGWYNLPQPRSYYVYDQNGDGTVDADLSRMALDCTQVADPDVNFPSYVGVNLAFNGNLDCCAWGGSRSLTRDGQTRSYRMTWLPPWAQISGVVAHEMGHGFGFPHSSGPYSTPYDSEWDPMSDGFRSGFYPTYGATPVHTITHHKDLGQWIPTASKFVPTPGSHTITLERLSQPTSAGTYLMAKIPIQGSTTNFYTVEARKFAGYDNGIPAEAVIIHNVLTTRSDRDAQVVDPDGNGNPNDAGARWLPGETYTDAAAGISIAVVGSAATTFTVTITLAGPDPLMAVDSPAAGSTLPQPFTISGWAIHPAAPTGTGVDAVHIWAYPSGGAPAIFAGAATYGAPRSDVSATHGSRFLNSGWSLAVRGLPPGTYTLQAHARSTVTGTFNQSRSVAGLVVQAQPRVAVDSPANGSNVSQPFSIVGWAADLASGTGTGVDEVHIWGQSDAPGAAPVFLGAATYGAARSDVAALLGAQFTNSGYQLSATGLAAGSYQISVYAHSTVTSTFAVVKTIQVTVAAAGLLMIESPADTSMVQQAFDLEGWAVDLSSATGSGVDAVHIYRAAQPGSGQPNIFVGAATYGLTRADVGAAHGSRFTPSGYRLRIGGLPQGRQVLIVLARSTVTGTFSTQRTITVEVRGGGVMLAPPSGPTLRRGWR
jgi:M6 family metalloprotease-like protein